MYKISVIVPVYNSEKYLEKCLKSLINQTMNEIEIILINDGSKDNSQKIIDKYVNEYPNKIKSIVQKNSGQACARNKGMEVASGEFVTFVDSDDYIENNTYEITYNYAKKNDLDIVCFDFNEIIDGKKEEKEHYIFDDNEDIIKKYIVSETSPWNKIIKRTILVDNKILFLENRIYEDLATIPILAKYTKKIDFLKDRLYNYVIHNNSTMRYEKYNSKLEDIFFSLDNVYNNFIDTPYKEELEYIYIEHLLHAASLRFLTYKEGISQIKKVITIIKERFPNWRENSYFRRSSIKYKIICNLLFYNQIKLVKFILSEKGK